MSEVFKIPTRMVEKVWGRDSLPSPFTAPKGKSIGEIWFEPPPELPGILIKYLFTSEKLSVQVHPSDNNALPGEAGKEECWLVLDADPGASLAIGFREETAPDQIERAAKDGSIEDLLEWHKAKTGDLFYLPAGTVHAIGAGLTLLEVQQSSDTTFRLYDYGRPRELHLERAVAVASGKPYQLKKFSRSAALGELLVDGPYFRLDRVVGMPSQDLVSGYRTPLVALPLEGTLRSSDGRTAATGGECLYASSIEALDFSDACITFLTRSVLE